MGKRNEEEQRIESPSTTEKTDTRRLESDAFSKERFECDIPLEIVSEEEMAFIEAALSVARSSMSASTSAITGSAPLSTIQRCSMASKKSISQAKLIIAENSSRKPKNGRRKCLQQDESSSVQDIENFAAVKDGHKRVKPEKSPLQQHRQRRGLSVTDITASEWCEKQMEFMLIRGRPEKTAAMKVGSARHTELEAEVLERVELDIKSKEDSWAIRLLNFILGANQLLFEGLTRELPVLGQVEGVWVTGVIDEARMCEQGGMQRPLLVDTKTRSRASPPSEPQKRNARLQLMCYKFLWDRIVTDEFPSTSFYEFFGLHPQRLLSMDIRDYIIDSSIGTNVQTLEDLMKYFQGACRSLPLAHEPLVLRYELQADRSLIGEEEFCYEANWLENRLQWHLQYWQGQREAGFVPEDESWKCRFCSFATICPRAELLSQEDNQ